ncbi:MAG: hypothetical protein OXH73_07995 [Caldilineaceae bacterium]|nr:hypothetical protein [Caldilineaceae bacterium]
MVERLLIGSIGQLLEWASEGYQAWEANARLLLRVTTLESVGIEVDPRNQTLKRLPTTTRQKDLR